MMPRPALFFPMLLLCLFVLLCTNAHAQDCLYNDTMCACSFGSSDGSCYDLTGSDSNGGDVCAKRACDPGWTCDCEGDFYCDQTQINVYTLLNPDDFMLDSDVSCVLVPQRTITSSGFQLGYWYPQFSDNGLLDQECQVFSWWLNGELQNEFTGPSETVTTSNLQSVRTALSDWNNLPLQPGTVIGFRWQGAAYSCYNSISQLNINGTVTDTRDTDLVSHRFSNNFEDDWMANDFVEGTNWRDPIETTYQDTYGLLNTAITNIYWRIKIL